MRALARGKRYERKEKAAFEACSKDKRESGLSIQKAADVYGIKRSTIEILFYRLVVELDYLLRIKLLNSGFFALLEKRYKPQLYVKSARIGLQ